MSLKNPDGIIIMLKVEALNYNQIYIKGMKKIRKFFGKNNGREIIAIPIQIEQEGKNSYKVYYKIMSVLLAKDKSKDPTYMASVGNMMFSTDYFNAIKKHFNNENYRKGARFEYRGMKAFRKKGWYTKRSFGSKGAEDFVAYRHGVGAFIQAKWSKNGTTKPEDYPDEVTRLLKKAKKYGAIPLFQCVNENRRMYFVNVSNGRRFEP